MANNCNGFIVFNDGFNYWRDDDFKFIQLQISQVDDRNRHPSSIYLLLCYLGIVFVHTFQLKKRLMKETIEQPELSKTEEILQGINLILKYEPTAEFGLGEYELFFGSSKTKRKMTKDERKIMDKWGWFIKEESWARHV